MGVFCQILVNRPRRGSHKAGSPVTGIIRYTLSEPEQFKHIILSLIGKGKCEWQERRGKQTYTFTGREFYTVQHMNVYNKGPEEVPLLPIGTYECPFTFVLPFNIPSSFNSNTGAITYKLVLKFERPSFFSNNKKFQTEIKVIGNAHPVTPEGVAVTELEKTLFKPFNKRKHRVHLRSEMPNTFFRPGENVQVTYKVTNDTDIIIPSVKAELICRKIYTANCGNRKKASKTICAVETPCVPDNAVANLMSSIPIVAHLYTIQHSRIITNEYRIVVTLRLPMPYINASMEIPIIIGEKHDDNYAELYAPGPAGFVEAPPPYFEAMNESKEDKDND